jgi:hypothetical protein
MFKPIVPQGRVADNQISISENRVKFGKDVLEYLGNSIEYGFDDEINSIVFKKDMNGRKKIKDNGWSYISLLNNPKIKIKPGKYTPILEDGEARVELEN